MPSYHPWPLNTWLHSKHNAPPWECYCAWSTTRNNVCTILRNAVLKPHTRDVYIYLYSFYIYLFCFTHVQVPFLIWFDLIWFLFCLYSVIPKVYIVATFKSMDKCPQYPIPRFARPGFNSFIKSTQHQQEVGCYVYVNNVRLSQFMASQSDLGCARTTTCRYEALRDYPSCYLRILGV